MDPVSGYKTLPGRCKYNDNHTLRQLILWYVDFVLIYTWPQLQYRYGPAAAQA